MTDRERELCRRLLQVSDVAVGGGRNEKLADDYGIDGHSHSWVTLQELYAYNWLPCRESVRRFVDQCMPRLVKLIMPDDQFPRVEPFLNAALEGDKTALLALHDWLEEFGLPSLEDVRMVYWFDN